MNIILKIFVALVFIYANIVNAQDLSKYYGTYKGKVTSHLDQTAKEQSAEDGDKAIITSEAVIIISHQNSISIDLKYRISFEKSPAYWDFKYVYSGTLNNGLKSVCKGEIISETYLNYFAFDGKFTVTKDKKPVDCELEIGNTEIKGFIGKTETKQGTFYLLEFNIPIKPIDEKCDISISVPPEVKPGGDFYVVVNKTGCVSYYTIYYNGKDKPITKWDGKEVDVEVQVECCDKSAFMKKLKVPAYGSGKTPTETKQDTNKPTDPEPKKLIPVLTTSFLLLKLLQLLTSGKGPKPVTPPPDPNDPSIPPIKNKPKGTKPDVKKPDSTKPEDKKKESDTKEQKPDAKKTDNTKPEDKKKETDTKEKKPDNTKPEDKKKESDTKDKKPLTPEEKKTKLEQMEKKLDALRTEAKNEGLSANSYTGAFRDSLKTIPASLIETKDTLVRVYDTTHKAFDKFKELGDELVENPKEREKFKENVSTLAGNLKDTGVNYYKNLEFVDDIKELKDYFTGKNKEFYQDFKKDPKKTMKEYVNAAFGTELYKKAFETDRPLEQRMLFLGLGYFNTYLTLSIGSSGPSFISNMISGKTASLNTLWQIVKLSYGHNSTLAKEQLERNFPEMYKAGKQALFEEAVFLKIRNEYFKYMEEPKKTTIAYNVNEELEYFNKWYKENLK